MQSDTQPNRKYISPSLPDRRHLFDFTKDVLHLGQHKYVESPEAGDGGQGNHFGCTCIASHTVQHADAA